VYELLGSAHTSVADVRSSMRDLVDALGRSVGSINDATGTIDGLMAQVRDAAAQGGVQISGPPDAQPSAGSATQSPAESTGPIAVMGTTDDAAAHRVSEGHEEPFGAEHPSGGAAPGAHGTEAAPAEDGESGIDSDGEDARRPLGQLFGASRGNKR
jgi:hypothetical protein